MRRLDGPVFAVLDGAHWADLPAELARLHVTARSLFLGAGREAEQAGPWLAELQGPDMTDALVGLVWDRPAAVFWCCPAGDQALWRHLRMLGQVRLTQDVSSGTVSPAKHGPGDKPAASESEVVLFRYWDPRVLSDVVPVLDDSGYARLLGPAERVVFLDPRKWGGVGVRALARLPDLPIAPRGTMTLDAAQVAAVDASAQQRSNRKTAAYLERNLPELARPMGQDALLDEVARCRSIGASLGLTTERTQMKWAFIMLLTGGCAADTPAITSFIRSGPRAPDQQVDDAMRQATTVARIRDSR